MPVTSSAPRRLVITGATGFLGRAVAHAALAAGWEVFAASRSAAAPEDGRYAAWWRMPGVTDAAAAREWLAEVNPDAVFHAAGSSDVRASFGNPRKDLQAALGSWSLWLEAARLLDSRPLMIFPSSAAVHGTPEVMPVAEDSPCRPISPYGMHKLMCELLAREYHEMLGLPVAVVRLFSLFGPSQKRLLVWEVFRKLRDAGDAVRLMGSGQERRDYLHEESVAEAILLLAADRERWSAQTALPIFNLGSGVDHAILSVAEQLRDGVSPSRKIMCEGLPRPGDPERWCADVGRFRASYPDWKPVGLEAGLARTVEAWMEMEPCREAHA